MFRKVQLKFFGIITAILIAIFIAVLSSVNIIMDVLMERQTNVVLRQVAAGVEYNDKTSTFTFNNPGRHKANEPKKDNIPPPTVPEESAAPAATEPASKNQTHTEEKSSEIPTEAEKTIQPHTAEKQPEPPKETEPPRETRPYEPKRTEPVRPTEPPAETFPPNGDWGNGENWGEWQPPENQDPDPWHDPWREPWNDPWHGYDDWNGDKDYNDNEHDRPVWGSGGFIPTANTAFVPVLNGYTVVVKAPASENEEPPPPPDGMGREPFGEPVPKSLGSINFLL